MKRFIAAAFAAAALITAPTAHADDPQPPPPPVPGQLSPGAADQMNKAYQDWQNMPCGASFGPVGGGFNWIRIKMCPPGTPPPD